MSRCRIPASMILVSSEGEFASGQRVCGTGGWIPPEQREALDWLTLSRFHGWGVAITRQTDCGFEGLLSDCLRWVVIACDPDSLGEKFVALLTSYLETLPILVVARAGSPNGCFSRLAGANRGSVRMAGRKLSWTGPGPARNWMCRNRLEAASFDFPEETKIWATLDGLPIICVRHVGQGMIATLGYHPSSARDADGAMSALTKHLLIWGTKEPVAWFDHEKSIVLRMDDPGSAESVHHRHLRFPKLGVPEWLSIGNDLKHRNARMSIGYVSGWVDDGDAGRGTITVEGESVPRVPGRVYPSPDVRYTFHDEKSSTALWDYQAEYRGIQALRAGGLAEVELHGYTHMHPDTISWSKAQDRYDSAGWYRELGPQAAEYIAVLPREEHPLAKGIGAFQRYFGVVPTTLICPGDQWVDGILEEALDMGLQLISSYYLALRDRDRFCWAQHVCAPYLDEPKASWLDAELPVVVAFHDFDLRRNGLIWLFRLLDQWQDAGVRLLMDLRELASMVGRRLYLKEHERGMTLEVASDDAPVPVRPIPIRIRTGGAGFAPTANIFLGNKMFVGTVQEVGDGTGRICLPEPEEAAGCRVKLRERP